MGAGNKESKAFICGDCGNAFSNKTLLEKHREIVHDKGGGEFPCSWSEFLELDMPVRQLKVLGIVADSAPVSCVDVCEEVVGERCDSLSKEYTGINRVLSKLRDKGLIGRVGNTFPHEYEPVLSVRKNGVDAFRYKLGLEEKELSDERESVPETEDDEFMFSCECGAEFEKYQSLNGHKAHCDAYDEARTDTDTTEPEGPHPPQKSLNSSPKENPGVSVVTCASCSCVWRVPGPVTASLYSCPLCRGEE